MGRVSTQVLAARCVDRALRPRFYGDGRLESLAVFATVESSDGLGDPVVLATAAASTALALSNVPWRGPVGASRIGAWKDELLSDPPPWRVEAGCFDLLYARRVLCDESRRRRGRRADSPRNETFAARTLLCDDSQRRRGCG